MILSPLYFLYFIYKIQKNHFHEPKKWLCFHSFTKYSSILKFMTKETFPFADRIHLLWKVVVRKAIWKWFANLMNWIIYIDYVTWKKHNCMHLQILSNPNHYLEITRRNRSIWSSNLKGTRSMRIHWVTCKVISDKFISTISYFFIYRSYHRPYIDSIVKNWFCGPYKYLNLSTKKSTVF